MKSIMKKIIVYSMVGILQCGLGTAVLEASPKHSEQPSRYENHYNKNNHNDRRNIEREKQRQEENERHAREMQRRHNESEREWRDRQQQENERHEQTINTIMGVALVYALLNS